MSIPLREWDADVGPVLRYIEDQAQWAELHARRVSNLCHQLRMVPDFHTRAKDEMDRALKALKAATSVLSDAVAMYEGKPVDE